MSDRLAAFIYRWRLPLTALILTGAVLSIPHADITHIDNDITAWFSKEDPVYKDYERFRAEFGGTRSLIVALKADSAERLFARDTLAFIERVTGDIERVDTVQRVDSLATATIVQATPDGLDVRPLLDGLGRPGDPAGSKPGVSPALSESGAKRVEGPETIKRLALRDDLIRGDLVSEDATVTALVVSFDEDRIDQVRAGVIQRIHDIVDPQLPAGVKAYYNGSLEISETYNRVTLDNQTEVRAADPDRHAGGDLPGLPLVAQDAPVGGRRSASASCWTLGLYSLMGYSYNVLTSMLIPLIVVLAIADDVHIMQHWDEERRRGDAEYAFKATVSHLAAPLFGASATTALGMLSLATSSVVAVQELRHRIGGRHHGRLRRSRSCWCRRCSMWTQSRTGRGPARALPGAGRCSASRGSRARTPGACSSPRSPSASSLRSGSCGCASTPTTSTSSAPRIRSASRRR